LSLAHIAYNSSKTLLDIWKDGGNANLDEEVETTDPWDAYVQFNSLLAESPYLSEDVLIEFINNPVFTSLMVKLLMIANPHAVDNEVVMAVLIDRNPALPQSYIDEIMSQPETTSQLTTLEGNVAGDYHLISTINEDIKRKYREDETNSWAKDSLIAFVNRQPDLYDKYELATIYLSYGQYTEMQNTIDAIETIYEMNDAMITDFANFETMMNIAKSMQQENLYEGGLSEAQQASLESILSDDRPFMAPIALALLKRNNINYIYAEAINDVPQSGARLAAPKHNVVSDVNVAFKLYPNPAKDYVTLSYNCKYMNISYSVSDIQGRIIKSNTLQTIKDVNSNEILIDLGGLSPGSYQITIKSNKTNLWSDKLIIIE